MEDHLRKEVSEAKFFLVLKTRLLVPLGQFGVFVHVSSMEFDKL